MRLHSRVQLLLQEEEKANKIIDEAKEKVKSIVKGRKGSNQKSPQRDFETSVHTSLPMPTIK
jgi:hypothetical protein